MQSALSLGSRSYGADQLLQAALFEEVGDRTSLNDAKNLLVFRRGREHHNLCCRGNLFDFAYSCHTIKLWHEQIQEQDIRQQFGGEGNRLFTVTALTNNRN